MPLLDHSRPPLSDSYPWESIHSAWASQIAEKLNTLLPSKFYALENKRFGNEIEIDVGTFDRDPTAPSASSNGTTTALLTAPAWAPPTPRKTITMEFPDTLEVRVFLREGRPKLVGVIELVSPSNKDRPAARDAFVAKCVDFLSNGVSLIVLDAITERRARLHLALMEAFDAADPEDEALTLYAASYRPVIRDERAAIDVWTSRVAVGEPLPTMHLRLTGDQFVPVDFEST